MSAAWVKPASAAGGSVIVGFGAFLVCGMAGATGDALACGCLVGGGVGAALGAWVGPSVFGLAGGF